MSKGRIMNELSKLCEYEIVIINRLVKFVIDNSSFSLVSSVLTNYFFIPTIIGVALAMT